MSGLTDALSGSPGMPGLLLTVPGTPGPKGSVKAWCTRCAKRRFPQRVVVTEESQNGVQARERYARAAKFAWSGRPRMTGPLAVWMWVSIERRMQIKNGQPTGQPVPSHAGPYPTHRNSGDIEKHARTLHDALQDAGVIADDAQVVHLHVYKCWADDVDIPGITFEVREIGDTHED